jgi:hypothetical protein
MVSPRSKDALIGVKFTKRRWVLHGYRVIMGEGGARYRSSLYVEEGDCGVLRPPVVEHHVCPQEKAGVRPGLDILLF